MECEKHETTWIDNRFAVNETGEQCSPLPMFVWLTEKFCKAESLINGTSDFCKAEIALLPYMVCKNINDVRISQDWTSNQGGRPEVAPTWNVKSTRQRD